MGIGASLKKSTQNTISAKDQELLDSPALLDLGHGTIRYRNDTCAQGGDTCAQEGETSENDQPKKKTGYFYHPIVELTSNDPDTKPESDYKYYYVFKGPSQMQGSKLYYVYGKGFDAKESGLRKGPVKPTGKGFTWPKEYYPPDSVFYNLSILYQDENPISSDSNSIDNMLAEEGSVDISSSSALKFILHSDDTLLTLKGKISLHNGVPLSLIHVLHDGQEVKNETVVGNLRPYEERGWDRFKVLLTPS